MSALAGAFAHVAGRSGWERAADAVLRADRVAFRAYEGRGAWVFLMTDRESSRALAAGVARKLGVALSHYEVSPRFEDGGSGLQLGFEAASFVVARDGHRRTGSAAALGTDAVRAVPIPGDQLNDAVIEEEFAYSAWSFARVHLIHTTIEVAALDERWVQRSGDVEDDEPSKRVRHLANVARLPGVGVDERHGEGSVTVRLTMPDGSRQTSVLTSDEWLALSELLRPRS